MPTAFLTASQEQALAQRWQRDGDYSARNELVTAYAPLVASIAKRYVKSGILREDLMQEGMLALMRAVDGFDVSRDIRFGTYARWWVRHMLTEALLRQGVVRPIISNKGKAAFFRGERVSIMSIHLPMDGKVIADFLESPEPRPDELAEQAIDGERLMAMLKQAMRQISSKEQAIIKARYSEEKSRLRVLGEKFGVSKERIRQIEVGALGKLRSALARRSAMEGA